MNTTSSQFAAEHDELEPLVAEHALGALEPALRPRVDAHLAECAACRATFDEVAAAVADVEVAVSPGIIVQPRVGATDGLLAAAVGTAQDTATGAPARSSRSRRTWRLPSLVAAAGACGTILVLAVLLSNSHERERSLERRLKDAKGDQVAVLRGASVSTMDATGPFGDARAQVVLQKDAGMVAFRDVPAPPEGMVWQVWAIGADEKIHSLGTIDDAQESAFLPIKDIDPDDIERIIVTIEPDGGSDEPSRDDEVADATV